ncbi:lymphocyte antigen 6E-like [Rhinatrema bivittatum]|uniref:lymphocyte antigen 6E-like n=1 Tax=Rhinatrema bivittatum TaxID=194408 RepID=UPI001129F6AA|nr:lymphocyte antigen 6E-like [Rhinatrema bivittatum]
MSGFLLSLLAAALCVQTAESFSCFQCHKQTNNLYCLKPVVCENSDTHCMTTVQSEGLDARTSYITKGCSQNCFEENVNEGVVQTATKCCNTFLCNFNGATSSPPQ